MLAAGTTSSGDKILPFSGPNCSRGSLQGTRKPITSGQLEGQTVVRHICVPLEESCAEEGKGPVPGALEIILHRLPVLYFVLQSPAAVVMTHDCIIIALDSNVSDY